MRVDERNSGASCRVPARTPGAIPIEAMTLEESVGDRPVDVIKIDVEGDDFDVLEHSPDVFRSARVVIVEVNPEQLSRNGAGLRPDPLALLRSYGFEMKLIAERVGYADWIGVRNG
jgi:hypothetical protein